VSAVQFESNRRSKRSLSGTLFVTFLFGAAIGFSLCYGLSVSLNWGRPDAEPRVEMPTQVPSPEPAGLADTPSSVELAAPSSQEPGSPYAAAANLAFDGEILAGRHLFVAVHGNAMDDAGAEFLGRLQPGGIVLRDENLSSDVGETTAFVRALRTAVSQGASLADRPLCAVFPQSGGLARFAGSDGPSAAELGADWDTERAGAIGREFGSACLERGISVVFSPRLDIDEPQGEHPELAVEAFGRDQGVVAAMGLALSEGLSSAGVAAVAVHYPGLGAARLDAAKDLWVIDRDVPQLAELMYPFAEAIAHGVPGVLACHAAVPALDKTQPDRPASMSPVLIRDVLRTNFKFNGVVMADDVMPPARVGRRTPGDAAVEALAAGCDALLFLDPDPVGIHGVCQAIEAAVRDGRLFKAELDASKGRLDAWADALRERFAIPSAPEAEEAEPDKGAVATPGPDAIEIDHMVKAGDVLCDLAKRFGVAVEDLKQWNNLTDDRLMPETRLVARIPRTAASAEVVAPDDRIEKEHTVAAGEGLFDVATAYDVTVLDLVRWNALAEGVVQEGQALKVFAPPPEERPQPKKAEPKKAEPTTDHRIERGETLESIARRYDTTPRKLMELNDIKNPHKILFGQKLKVPKR